MNPRHALLAEFPVIISVTLHWGDMDAFRHVNNLVYLRWCESARVEYLTRVGLWQERPGEGVGPILASVSSNYRKPLTYPDVVWVGARVTRIGNSSFKMEHMVVSRSLDAVAAEVESTIVVLDYGTGKTVPVPLAVRAAIEKLEGKPLHQAAKA
jgi:acyl-CoA thioester hydrolase